jgi:hypothetical protein
VHPQGGVLGGDAARLHAIGSRVPVEAPGAKSTRLGGWSITAGVGTMIAGRESYDRRNGDVVKNREARMKRGCAGLSVVVALLQVPCVRATSQETLAPEMVCEVDAITGALASDGPIVRLSLRNRLPVAIKGDVDAVVTLSADTERVFTTHIHPVRGTPLKPYRTMLMSGPDGGGRGRPFIPYFIPEVFAIAANASTRLDLKLTNAAWFARHQRSVAFGDIPAGQYGLRFATFRLPINGGQPISCEGAPITLP